MSLITTIGIGKKRRRKAKGVSDCLALSPYEPGPIGAYAHKHSQSNRKHQNEINFSLGLVSDQHLIGSGGARLRRKSP